MISSYQNMKIYFCVLSLVSLILCADVTLAKRDVVTVPAKANLTLHCISTAAVTHDVPLAVLLGILATEGGRPGQALSNCNGTWDMGPFQVNTCHVEQLLQHGIKPEDVLADACVNADAAAWLLRQEMIRSHDIWEAIGAYHSRTAHYHLAYIQRVKTNLAKLQQGRVSALIDYANGDRRSW